MLQGWFGDAVSHLKLDNVTELTAGYGELPDFTKVPGGRAQQRAVRMPCHIEAAVGTCTLSAEVHAH